MAEDRLRRKCLGKTLGLSVIIVIVYELLYVAALLVFGLSYINLYIPSVSLISSYCMPCYNILTYVSIDVLLRMLLEKTLPITSLLVSIPPFRSIH